MKIGVVSCSGEECTGGTISRLATRKMLDEIRPADTVTICLPLYMAGGEEERGFAQNFPTITVDGCSKMCAKKATEKYSGKVTASIDVSEIIGKDKAGAGPLSIKYLTDEHREMVDKVTDVISEKSDDIVSAYLKKRAAGEVSGEEADFKPGCGCSG